MVWVRSFAGAQDDIGCRTFFSKCGTCQTVGACTVAMGRGFGGRSRALRKPLRADVSGAGTPRNNYASVVETRFLPIFTPDDARIAELLASLSQLDNGVTTSIDTSFVHHSPELCFIGRIKSPRDGGRTVSRPAHRLRRRR